MGKKKDATKLRVGDEVVPNGMRLFQDYSVSKIVRAVANYEGVSIIAFNGEDKFYKMANYTRDEELVKSRKAAFDNCRYLHREMLEEAGWDENIHISSASGEVKVGKDSVEDALVAAWRMANLHGGEWVYYQCPICHKYHIGRQHFTKSAVAVISSNARGYGENFKTAENIVLVSRKDNHQDLNLPGGKVEEGETSFEAIAREIQEETGLILRKGTGEFVNKIFESKICGKFLVDVYHFSGNDFENYADFNPSPRINSEGALLKIGHIKETYTEGNSFGKFNLDVHNELKRLNRLPWESREDFDADYFAKFIEYSDESLDETIKSLSANKLSIDDFKDLDLEGLLLDREIAFHECMWDNITHC